MTPLRTKRKQLGDMSRGRRYFKNSLADYSIVGENVKLDFVQGLISSYVEQIAANFQPTLQNADGGLYVGAPGVAFMFLKLSTCNLFQEKRTQFLETALSYVKVGIEEASRVPAAGHGGIGSSFLLGHAGVYGLASVIFHEIGDKANAAKFVQKFLEMNEICYPSDKSRGYGTQFNELFVGRAGYLCMALWMNKMLGSKVVPSNVTEVIFNAIIHDGKSYSHQHRSSSPLMYSYYETKYLGAAHGLSSILQMLLCFPEFYSGKSDMETILKNSTDFVLHCKQENGNYPPATGERRDRHHELIHWCHGAPGVLYLLVKAYLQWEDEKYIKAALECGELVWNQGLLYKGPGICHGVAGNGYVFLILYRLTNDVKFLHRAGQFARFLTTDEFLNGARTPDSPYSLYEGLAGTVCFLVDLLDPAKAEFPFFDVFS